MSETPQPRGKKVTKGKVVRRKKKQSGMSDSFDTALSHATSEILIPSAKEILLDTITTIVSSILYPDGGRANARPSRRKSTVISGGGSYTNYSRVAASPRAHTPQRTSPGPTSRSFDEWGEIIFQTRGEAKAVLDSMYNILNDYEVVTISDLLIAVGEHPSHTDLKWGWEDLRGTTIDRVRGGFILSLPNPVHVG